MMRGALPAAGAALRRGAAPLPALAAARLRPGDATSAGCSTCSCAACAGPTPRRRRAPCGVFSLAPPAALIVELSDLLAGASVTVAGPDSARATRVRPLRAPACSRVQRRRGARRRPTSHVARRLGALGGRDRRAGAARARADRARAAARARCASTSPTSADTAPRRRATSPSTVADDLPWPEPAAWVAGAAPRARSTVPRPAGAAAAGRRAALPRPVLAPGGAGPPPTSSRAPTRPPPPSTSRACAASLDRAVPGRGADDRPAARRAAVAALRRVDGARRRARAPARRRRSRGCSPLLRRAAGTPTCGSRSPRPPARPPPGCEEAVARPRPARAGRAGRQAAASTHPPAARLAARPASRFRHDRDQPAALRRRGRRRDLDGVADPDGAAARGACAPHARLVLVGDPDQLASVEAGAVLGDLVDAPAARATAAARRRAARRRRLLRRPGATASSRLEHIWPLRRRASPRSPTRSAPGTPTRPWRCLRSGVVAGVLESVDLTAAGAREALADPARRRRRAAAARWPSPPGRATPTTAWRSAASEHRLLCAHRRGPYGVARWAAAGRALARRGRRGRPRAGGPRGVVARAAAARHRERPRGRPLQRRHRGRRRARTAGCVAVSRGAAARSSGAPALLGAVETVHAMTVHRGAGQPVRAGSASCCRPPSRRC